MAYQHPQVPWVSIEPLSANSVQVTDTRTGEQQICTSDECVDQFAADHSAAVGRRGAGDLVAAATHALGIPECGGCQQRHMALNRMFPGIGGRRR